jgi:hypothetical protein
LPELGVAGLSVDYASIREPDGQGNVLRYSAPVHVTPGSSVGMTAWDVMLTSPYASEWNYGAPRIEEPPEEQTTGIGSTGVGQEFASGAEKGSRGVAEKGGGQFWLHGDRVYKLVSGTSWAIGQGWWTKDMEVIATQADVRVRLQHYFNGVWVTVGTSPPVPRRMAASVHEDLPPPPHLRAENGQVCTYN